MHRNQAWLAWLAPGSVNMRYDTSRGPRARNRQPFHYVDPRCDCRCWTLSTSSRRIVASNISPFTGLRRNPS